MQAVSDKVQRLFLIPSELPCTGPIKVNRECSAEEWQDCMIVQHGGDSFRIHDKRENGFAITLSTEDGLWLIETLKLGAKTDSIMRRVVIWSN